MKRRLVFALSLVACTGDPYATTPRPAAKSAPASAPAPTKPKFVAGNAAGEIPPAVARQVKTAKAEGERVVVYVGATWCEPCQRFHKAVEAGELDDRLAGVRFVEYDADRDRERLADAGYDGRLIPRFALPAQDGRFGGEKIEGGTKGEGAVEAIMSRLDPLLAKAP